tara:strand:+ start:803 stop:1189 length:387 start_codon:yes stop_codon:yes gene_type:complete
VTILQYVGDRPYVEFKVGQTTFGFARGTERSDVPQELLDRFTGDNYPQWKVTGLETKDEEKAKKMVEVIEATVVEETPTVVEEVAFDTEWTRVKMVEWMKARGESVSKADTKAILTERADALTSKGDE